MTPKKLYRVVAISQAITWPLLFAGLTIRATTGFAPVVTIGGSIHGLVSLSRTATRSAPMGNETESAVGRPVTLFRPDHSFYRSE